MLHRSMTESVTSPIWKSSAMREPAKHGISSKLNLASPHSKYSAARFAYLRDSWNKAMFQVHCPFNIFLHMKSISSYITQRPPQVAELPPTPLLVQS